MRPIIVCSLLFVFTFLSAQTPASVNWLCMPPDSQQVSSVSGNLSGLTETGSPGFVVRDYANGPGPDQRWWPFENGSAVSWGDETGQVDTRWVQFTAMPNANFSFHADSITLYLGGKGTDKIRANIVFDKKPDFSAPTTLNSEPLALVKDSDSLYQFVLDVEVADQETLYIRIYPWYAGSASTSKYLYMRDVTIWGTSESVSYPVSAIWELTDPDNGGTGLVPTLTGWVNAEDELLFNAGINHYSGPENSQRVRIANNQWPANQTEQIDTVYIQFAALPKESSVLTVSEISLKIAAASIDKMKANVWYSSDSTFASAVQVDYTTPDASGNNYLPIDTLIEVTANPGVTVNPGEKFYVRVYPWVDNDPSIRTGKYVCLKEVVISGSSEGTIVFQLPEVATQSVANISTTFATSGGNISTDGGAPVTARGVCWNTTGTPTEADDHTDDGSGTGAFVSTITGLTPGETYYLRAYAVNEAGTGYGEEVTFNALDSTIVPTVITSQVDNILVTSATCGGNVTHWGGDTVTVRGVCWNTAGNPTLADSYTENGSGLGSFTSTLYPLTENTTYYVRAYATNSKGTGYGDVQTFVTQTPAPDVVKIVAQDGSGDYTTVQAAFDAVPEFYTGEYTIYVKAGTYYEKLLLDRNKPNVILQGEDAETTILTYDDYAGKAGGTSQCQSVAIDADDFTAMDITFQNTIVNDGSFNDQQGVALRVNGDRQSYYRCRLLGYQDTYYTWGGRGTGRVYMKECNIEGSVDFIFGRDIVVFDQCEIHINRDGGSLTAASTEPESKFGYVFLDCNITADDIGFNGNAITRFILGRPWQAAPRTVFIRCEEPASVNPAGWSTWNVAPALYAEYQCTGPGSDSSNRLAISRQLTNEEAPDYTIENIFAKTSNPGFGYDWLPEEPVKTGVDDSPQNNALPTAFSLYQNYPNPFNPTTTIRYDVPVSGKVSLKLFNALGEEVLVLADNEKEAGRYQVTFDGSALSTGIYLYQLKAEGYYQIRKMMLLK